MDRPGYRMIYHYELAQMRGSISKGLERDLTAAERAQRNAGFCFRFWPSEAQADELTRALDEIRLAERAA